MTQERLREDALTVIELRNKFIEKVVDNNEFLLKIIDDGSSCIDPQDADWFLEFYEHVTRLSIEIGKDGQSKTPFEVYNTVGEISFMKPEFIELISKRFEEKIKNLKSLF